MHSIVPFWERKETTVTAIIDADDMFRNVHGGANLKQMIQGKTSTLRRWLL